MPSLVKKTISTIFCMLFVLVSKRWPDYTGQNKPNKDGCFGEVA